MNTVLFNHNLLPPLKTIGTFLPLDGVNQPSVNGFSAGTFVDGSQVYMGYGDNSECYNESPCPGRSKFKFV